MDRSAKENQQSGNLTYQYADYDRNLRQQAQENSIRESELKVQMKP